MPTIPPRRYRVIKFYKVDFDENWTLLNNNNQIFEYLSTKVGARIAVHYEGPQGDVFTAVLACEVERKIFIHRDVIHVPTISEKTIKGYAEL